MAVIYIGVVVRLIVRENVRTGAPCPIAALHISMILPVLGGYS